MLQRCTPQQVDMRTENSWTQTLSEVNSVELVECHAINTFAPFIITSELKPLMDRVPDVGMRSGWKASSQIMSRELRRRA